MCPCCVVVVFCPAADDDGVGVGVLPASVFLMFASYCSYFVFLSLLVLNFFFLCRS